MKRWRGENIFDAFACLVSLLFIGISLKYSATARTVPLGVGILTVAIAGGRLASQYRRGASPPDEEPEEVGDRDFWRRLSAYYVWLVGFFLLTVLIGFPFAIPVFAFLFLWVQARERWLSSAILAVGMDLVIYVFFVKLVGVIFPTGMLFSL